MKKSRSRRFSLEMVRRDDKAPVLEGEPGPVRSETLHAEQIGHEEQRDYKGNKINFQCIE